MKTITKILFALALMFVGVQCSASEVTGTLTTGISTGLEGTVIVSPSATPIAGIYTTAQSVVLTALGAQSIRYTVDGSTPTCSSGTIYGGAISVATSQVIQALSCYPNSAASSVVTFGYAINPPTPPSGGGGGGGGGGGSPSPAPATTSADTNNDGKVDVLDFNTLMSSWGTGSSSADFNKDGKVDILDFNFLMSNWS